MHRPTDSLVPGQTIGILGGGQLGRMLALAAARLGLHVHIYDPDERCPAAEVSFAHTVASFEDAASMASFVSAVDAITFEWEGVPTNALAGLARTPPIRPSVAALRTLQDRLAEKQRLSAWALSLAMVWAKVQPDAGVALKPW